MAHISFNLNTCHRTLFSMLQVYEKELFLSNVFFFFSPLVYIDPLHANLATMLANLFRDSLNEYAYAAEIAGLKYSLSSTAYGINVI